MSASQISKSDPDSVGEDIFIYVFIHIYIDIVVLAPVIGDVWVNWHRVKGAVSAVDDENMCPSSKLVTPVTVAASKEGLVYFL